MEAGPEAIREPSGSLMCTLLDRRSSVPLSGARITCVWRDNRISLLDSDPGGNFSAALPPGVYDLMISARGYLSLIVRGVGILPGHALHVVRALVPGEGTDLEAVPATAVGGFITDRLGRGVSNVTVHLTAEDGSNAYTTRSERDGAYIVHGVVPDMYDLAVRAMERTLVRDYVPIAHVKHFVRFDLQLQHI
jgi:hypothetical protein